MTPQELKNSILQLAIQGKLVEQRPEEGSAEDQLSYIRKQLNTKRKDFLEDELTLDLPETWAWVCLSELTTDDVLNDGNWVLSNDMVVSGPVKLIQLGSIGNGRYIDKGFKYLTEKHFHELNGRQVFGGYLMVNRLIGDRMLSCILPDIDGILMTAVDACWIAPQDDIYDIKYLMYVLLSNDFQEKVKGLGRGTTRFRVSKSNLISIAFPFPPLAEQKRIVAKIEELLPYIDRYEKAWNRLADFNKRFPTDMQKSILQLAIQGKLVEQRPEEGTGEELYKQIKEETASLIAAKVIKEEKLQDAIDESEIPFDIPANWTWVRFGNLGRYKKGPFGSALTKGIFVPKSNDTVKVYEQKNAIQKDASLGEYYITKEYFESKMTGFEVQPGDIIVSCAGTIGETFVLPDGIEKGIINQALMRMRLFKPIYVPYFLMFFDVVLKQNAQQNSKGSAIKNIPPFEILKNYLVPLPPLAEQKRIVAKLEELLPLCKRLK